MPYLYRGTTAGWPGNPCLQRERLTPTTTDPLIATLFGVECRRWGRAIVLVVDRERIERLLGTENVLADIEQEVVIRLSPSEFAEYASHEVPIEQAWQWLREIGYELPIRIDSRRALNDELLVWRRL